MHIDAARAWLVRVSLIVLTVELSFFLTAPLWGYPLAYDEVWRLLQILMPVFVGYLASATQFVFAGQNHPAASVHVPLGPQAALFGLIVRGPIYVWILGTVAALVAFGITNADQWAGPRLSLDALAASVTATLSILTATTAVVVAKIFGNSTNQPSIADNERDVMRVRVSAPANSVDTEP